jgi:hypothetical protein
VITTHSISILVDVIERLLGMDAEEYIPPMEKLACLCMGVLPQMIYLAQVLYFGIQRLLFYLLLLFFSCLLLEPLIHLVFPLHLSSAQDLYVSVGKICYDICVCQFFSIISL